MSDRELVGLGALVFLLLLLLLRIPVAVAMFATGVLGSWVLSLVAPFLRFEPYLRQFKTLFWNVAASYDLSVVPLFILMGYLASHGGLARDLFHGLQVLTGRRRGGVAMAAIAACAGFGAVCGSSLATASTMGRVALPELARLGYRPRLSTGTLAAGGTLGILIPPSVPLVIYAIVVEASIVRMFQAAILPGILAVVLFLLVIALRVRLDPTGAPATPPLPPAERQLALLRFLPVMGLFAAIVAGLGLGLFTPTPAAGVAVCLILVHGAVLRALGLGGIGVRELGHSLLDTAVTSAMLYFILFGAEVLKGFFARTGLPAALASWAAHSGFDPWSVLIAILLLLVVLGCFLESLSMIVVVLPFFWPVLLELNGGEAVSAADAAFGLDADELKIWFGILALVVVELGLITPPVGLNLFIIGSLAPDVPMRETIRGVLPFLASETVRVGLLLLAPVLALALPRWLSG